DFEHLPAKAHQLLKKALAKHCGERYTEYLGKLKRGEAKINTAGLMPHELAAPYITGRVRQVDETIEGAWRTLLAKLKAKCSSTGGLKNAIAIVDVSGSMTCNGGIPMNVGISLGLLISELAVGPFQGRCITFSEQPTWHAIPQNTTLYEQVTSMQRMNWGMSTNLMSVFEMILTTAVKARVSQAEMPSTMFILSDMQFNQACRGDEFMNSGAYRTIKAKYATAGCTIPSIIFWNLNGATHGDFPVDVTTEGVALIGGYSAELLKAFLEGHDINPMNIMLQTIKPYSAVIEESER
ncbi:MAG: DUF2828 family protein, partial [Dehalococcoidales bacterium]|nr:DUF2828 family protein [Dehalococcoidales bacterium]